MLKKFTADEIEKLPICSKWANDEKVSKLMKKCRVNSVDCIDVLLVNECDLNHEDKESLIQFMLPIQVKLGNINIIGHITNVEKIVENTIIDESEEEMNEMLVEELKHVMILELMYGLLLKVKSGEFILE